MKFSSQSALILSVTFFLVAFLWLFWVRSTELGLIWLVVAIGFFCIYLKLQREEQK